VSSNMNRQCASHKLFNMGDVGRSRRSNIMDADPLVDDERVSAIVTSMAVEILGVAGLRMLGKGVSTG
jgi:hypothetical protein